MAEQTLEARVAQLENRLRAMEEMLSARSDSSASPSAKRGWRAIVGIHADNPRFEEAQRLGREWRFADSPKDESAA